MTVLKLNLKSFSSQVQQEWHLMSTGPKLVNLRKAYWKTIFVWFLMTIERKCLWKQILRMVFKLVWSWPLIKKEIPLIFYVITVILKLVWSWPLIKKEIPLIFY